MSDQYSSKLKQEREREKKEKEEERESSLCLLSRNCCSQRKSVGRKSAPESSFVGDDEAKALSKCCMRKTGNI